MIQNDKEVLDSDTSNSATTEATTSDHEKEKRQKTALQTFPLRPK